MKAISRGIIPLILFLLLIPGKVFPHGGEKHSKKLEDSITRDSSPMLEQKSKLAQFSSEQTSPPVCEKTTTRGFPSMSEFPSLHPLVVHFPVVLLFLAIISQLAGLFIFKKELAWVTLFLLVGGLLGAFVAANLVHPHTHGLSSNAANILETHEFWAEWTIWISLGAMILKAITIFLWKDQKWLELIILGLCLGSSVSVGIAGHYGATLVHIEGVGPQGNYLEKTGHDHAH